MAVDIARIQRVSASPAGIKTSLASKSLNE
jgi:hypothetical protein